MFSKILIANRGEIACRIIRACKGLGIRTVAIYSEADRESLHVKQADEAVCVGPPPNDQSYLDMPNVLMAAVITGADAVHPGYGYFSERENFADALEAIGIKFIGPPVEAIAQMGDKARAREAAMEAGVPVVPGSEGVVRTESEALEIAEAIGYPVLIKAAAGGGGRGIRKATNPENLVSQMQTARQEAEASFGSGAVYIEKLIENPRHVEVQIIADAYGSCVHLGERECSVQNLRHQKMIEEAPFALLSPEKRQEIGEAAVRIARQVGYVNAGTVEFLMDAEGNYYFIEMNTRLQVEHPVTEQVTGIDIVRTQIEVAAGKELPFTQEDITWTGHAIEARITAEDPDRNFAPSCGKITEWNPPKGEPIRLESHLYRGFEVSPFYDPMIAKLIVTAHDRVAAVELLSRALDEFRIEGIKTNIPFLKHLVQTEEYVKGDVHTQTVAQMMQPAEAHAR
ncbi:MAG: acetyl-CoA carboxylase biotin carboxylase subunit [Armatimonadetes bacterium]|nr:MAG: acetyl-CoA carboxylase biotin carboxylase subunit [Armatimonadota bacterium]